MELQTHRRFIDSKTTYNSLLDKGISKFRSFKLIKFNIYWKLYNKIKLYNYLNKNNLTFFTIIDITNAIRFQSTLNITVPLTYIFQEEDVIDLYWNNVLWLETVSISRIMNTGSAFIYNLNIAVPVQPFPSKATEVTFVKK